MEDYVEIMRLAKIRKEIREEIIERSREFSLCMEVERKKIIELMRRRHAYYTKLITDAGIKSAKDFYDRFREHFKMYGIDLTLSDDKSCCSIDLELEDDSYEEYRVIDSKIGNFAEVSPEVAYKDLFRNAEVNIFTEEGI